MGSGGWSAPTALPAATTTTRPARETAATGRGDTLRRSPTRAEARPGSSAVAQIVSAIQTNMLPAPPPQCVGEGQDLLLGRGGGHGDQGGDQYERERGDVGHLAAPQHPGDSSDQAGYDDRERGDAKYAGILGGVEVALERWPRASLPPGRDPDRAHCPRQPLAGPTSG